MRKRRFLEGLAGLGVTFLIVTSCGNSQNNIKNLQAGAGNQIIVLGDSIASGYGVKETESFPSVLSRLLNLSIVNRGVAGDTTADGLNRLQQDVLSASPWLVIVELGGNDYLRKIPISETEQNLRQIITQIQAQNAIVVLLGINTGVVDEYQEMYANLAEETQSFLIPQIFTGILNSPKHRQEDGIHPNAAGHEKLAQRVAAALKPLLKQAKKPPSLK